VSTIWQSLPRIRTLLRDAETLGATVPADLADMVNAAEAIKAAAVSLPDPDEVLAEGVAHVNDSADAVALLDEVIDAETRAAAAGAIRGRAETIIAGRLIRRLRDEHGLDDLLDQLRPAVREALAAVSRYSALVPAGATGAELLDLGPEVADAWRAGKAHVAVLNALLRWLDEAVMVVDPFPADDVVGVPLAARVGAFLIDPAAPLDQAARALVESGATADDPVGNRRRLGDLRLNSLATARSIIADNAAALAAAGIDFGEPTPETRTATAFAELTD